jgi:excisionase family DNA binding protein
MQVDRGELGALAQFATSTRSPADAAERPQRLGVLKGFDSHTTPLYTTHEGRLLKPRKEQVMNQVAEERLMTIADLSTMLGVPVDTLYGWRHRGEGPRGYRVGRHVRYRRSSVEAWLEEQAVRRQSPRE